jgi:hypothetical protein
MMFSPSGNGERVDSGPVQGIKGCRCRVLVIRSDPLQLSIYVSAQHAIVPFCCVSSRLVPARLSEMLLCCLLIITTIPCVGCFFQTRLGHESSRNCNALERCEYLGETRAHAIRCLFQCKEVCFAVHDILTAPAGDYDSYGGGVTLISGLKIAGDDKVHELELLLISR